ncbi:MAG: glutathione S-transferase family protein [Acidobacteriota bacterium]
MTTLLLWEHPLSPYAQKVKIALRLKGIPFEARIPTGIGADEVDRLAAANPRSEVPTLEHDGAHLFDSTVLLEYLEDRFPEPPLLPKEALARARARTIEDVMDTHYEAINWGLGEVHYFQRAEGETREALLDAASRQTHALQSWLERQLGAGPWCHGDSFGWADLSVVPYLNGSVGFDLGPQPESALADWLGRANALPEVAETAQEAVDSIAGMAQVAELVRGGAFKRQYRDHRLEWMIKSGGLDVVVRGVDAGNVRFTEF